jgi:hypothetical protein
MSIQYTNLKLSIPVIRGIFDTRNDYATCCETEYLPSRHQLSLIQLTLPPRFSLGLSNNFVKRPLCPIFKGLTVNRETHHYVGGTFALCFGGAGFKSGP